MTTVFHSNKPISNWKGLTFKQVTYDIQRNGTNNTVQDAFKSRPLKIYRKELSTSKGTCNPRTSIKIDDINRPGGSNFIQSTMDAPHITSDINYENNSCQHLGKNECNDIDFSPANNALRRLRSSGMNPRKYDINSKNNYFSSTKQYLDNRNMSYKNNTNFVMTTNSVDNAYTSGSLNNCPHTKVIYKPNNTKFAVQGAVSSSDLITRKKYDEITNVGGSFRSAFGDHTANAMAYGVSDYGYTVKDKKGYPLKQTPVFSKYSNVMIKCTPRKFSNII